MVTGWPIKASMGAFVSGLRDDVLIEVQAEALSWPNWWKGDSDGYVCQADFGEWRRTTDLHFGAWSPL